MEEKQTEFLNTYMKSISLYIHNGKPSEDTLKTYKSAIKQFISWCGDSGYNIFKIQELHIRMYFQYLYDKQYKHDTVNLKINAVRIFYKAALGYGLVKINPCSNIRLQSELLNEKPVSYFSTDQLYEICDAFENDSCNQLIKYRNLAILYLMAVEGLRVVEVHRLNYKDIDWINGSILIYGKRFTRYIYPCESTFKYIELYHNELHNELSESRNDLPAFLSDSNKNANGRLSRNGIRFIMNKALELTGYKKEGVSCHIFRHSCGTNLYNTYKDIRLVQEVLGHKDIKTTSRYAHIQEKLSKRKTEAIIPKKKEKDIDAFE